MRKFISVFIILLAIAIDANSQDNQKPAKNKFFLQFGLENRITPIHIGKTNNFSFNDLSVPSINEDPHLSGTAISFGLSYQMARPGTTFSLSYAFRYDYLFDNLQDTSQFTRSEYGLISDVHMRVFQPIKIKKIILKPGIGYSIMNKGTEYVFYNGSGSGTQNLQFNAFDISLGTEIDNFMIDLRTYFIEEFTIYSSPLIIVPEISILYRLGI